MAIHFDTPEERQQIIVGAARAITSLCIPDSAERIAFNRAYETLMQQNPSMDPYKHLLLSATFDGLRAESQKIVTRAEQSKNNVDALLLQHVRDEFSPLKRLMLHRKKEFSGLVSFGSAEISAQDVEAINHMFVSLNEQMTILSTAIQSTIRRRPDDDPDAASEHAL